MILITYPHITGLNIAWKVLFVNALTILVHSLHTLRPGVGAGPHLDHDPSPTRGITGGVDRGPRTPSSINIDQHLAVHELWSQYQH